MRTKGKQWADVSGRSDTSSSDPWSKADAGHRGLGDEGSAGVFDQEAPRRSACHGSGAAGWGARGVMALPAGSAFARGEPGEPSSHMLLLKLGLDVACFIQATTADLDESTKEGTAAIRNEAKSVGITAAQADNILVATFSREQHLTCEQLRELVQPTWSD